MTIGALRPSRVPYDRAATAVDYAMTLISGWEKGKKGPLGKELGELKEVSAHNQDVYKQASEALNELSARDRAVRDGEARLKQDRTVLEVLSSDRESELSERETAMKADEDGLAKQKADFERLKATLIETLALREKAAAVSETAAVERQKELDTQDEDIGRRENISAASYNDIDEFCRTVTTAYKKL